MTLSRPTRLTLLGATALALALAFVGALWLGLVGGHGNRAHDAAVELWESKEPASYSFDFFRCSGMCANCPVHVTVRDGVVTGAVPGAANCSYAAEHAPTVEDVFAMEAADREAEGTDSYDIEYDPTWGFPASVEIRCPPGTMDCGTGYTITDFDPDPLTFRGG